VANFKLQKQFQMSVEIKSEYQTLLCTVMYICIAIASNELVLHLHVVKK
jgi:hypothetical protein